MAQETEIKLRINDARDFQRRLKRLGVRILVSRTREVNVLFDTARADLKDREQLLRIRTEKPATGRNRRRAARQRVLLTFKRPVEQSNKAGAAERHKTREELELEASDAKALANIFEALGLREWFRYEKIRTTYCLPDRARWAKGLLIELDETPIGLFAELEGPAKAIDRTAKELGFAQRDYIVANYMELYRDHCRERGTDGRDASEMVFAKDQPQRARKKSKKLLKQVGFS
jgi:adenylate cyclase, class 2